MPILLRIKFQATIFSDGDCPVEATGIEIDHYLTQHAGERS